jgi:fructokinase
MSMLGKTVAEPVRGVRSVDMTTVYGAVEAGGTKVLCLVGSGPDDVRRSIRIPTGEPGPTLRAVVDFFRAALADGEPIEAIGVGSFGPLELRPDTPAYGRILRTPKAGWSGVDVLGPLRDGLGLPVGLETDVNAAALGEGRWGAARGCRSFVYVTVGTGIGGGAVVAGRLVGGLGHPEMGHLAVPRLVGDDFAGTCRYHRDCWEGLACGPALAARFGRPAEALEGDDLAAAVRLEAAYLALGLRALVYSLAPERIVLGGGVAELSGLLEATRTELVRTLGGYPGLAEHGREEFLVRPGLGDRAGVLGALIVAERAAAGLG